MIDVGRFVEIITGGGQEPFFTGVPDSLLRPFCDYLTQTYGISRRHIVAANEGNCVGLAAGYHLATGKTPVVYLQNSGIGHIINPAASLLHEKVYGIPCVFVIGWRGRPGVGDEPQHRFQGEVTLRLLEDMEIHTAVLAEETGEAELRERMEGFRPLLARGKSVAFVVCENALRFGGKAIYRNSRLLTREEIIGRVAAAARGDVIVSTTGKASRELFALRERNGESHRSDFLTVGSMGHCSSIAAGIAAQKRDTRVWCVDGDGSLLMHMGAMAVLGAGGYPNIVHLCVNNGAHESVGGMPTVAERMNLVRIAEGCGYATAVSVSQREELDKALLAARESGRLSFIEAKAAIGSRKDLGRPTETPEANKRQFMAFLRERHS